VDIFVVKEGEEPPSSSRAAKTVQTNSRPGQKPEAVCKAISGMIGVWAPACSPDAAKQIGDACVQEMTESYASAIFKASELGYPGIILTPLGTKVVSAKDGKVVRDLYWTHVQSALAAKAAVQWAAPYLAKEFLIVFSVPKDAYTDWDDAMKF